MRYLKVIYFNHLSFIFNLMEKNTWEMIQLGSTNERRVKDSKTEYER